MKEAQEHITTVEDGPDTVNERLTTGGEGPEGQSDTVYERLSGSGPDRVAERPADSANKPAWVDYAVEQGAERDGAEAQTKQELIDSYGG